MVIDDYMAKADDMVLADEKRDDLFEAIDDMWHGKWELPAAMKLKPDMREIIDLSPHDALKSGTAILSTSMPHWEVQPIAPNQGEYERAESIGYAIDYNYRRMGQRGRSTVLWDMVHSCLRYDAVAVWLDYLPYQFMGKDYSPAAYKKMSLRQKHALRGGDFAAIVHNPRNVHVQQDNYGINAVLLRMNMTAQEVVYKWGDKAAELKAKLKKDEDTGTTRFIYNDLMLYEGDEIKRVIWGSLLPMSSDTEQGGSDEFVIMNEVAETPFMPWVIRVGGSGLEQNPEYSVHPLLAPLYFAHKWSDLNAFQSILQSEIIKYGRAPRVKTITPSGGGVDIDYEDGSTLNLRTGEQADPWKPAPIDPNLSQLVDRVRAEVSSATLPRILQNPEFAGNTPFASINAMIQTALGGLNPAKTLCERAHEELALKMVEWCYFAKKPLLAYRKDRVMTEDAADAGNPVELTPEKLDPEGIMITCRLSAEAPTDFAQRLNAAIMQNQQLNVPKAKLLEELGRENVPALFDQWAQEKEDETAIQIDLQSQQAQAQMQIQMAAQQAQMQMQQQQMAAQQQGAQQNAPGMEGAMPQGEGMNQNVGPTNQPGQQTTFLHPSTGNPGVSLREQMSGQDVTGAGT